MAQRRLYSTQNLTGRRGLSCPCDLISPSVCISRLSLGVSRSPREMFLKGLRPPLYEYLLRRRSDPAEMDLGRHLVWACPLINACPDWVHLPLPPLWTAASNGWRKGSLIILHRITLVGEAHLSGQRLVTIGFVLVLSVRVDPSVRPSDAFLFGLDHGCSDSHAFSRSANFVFTANAEYRSVGH